MTAAPVLKLVQGRPPRRGPRPVSEADKRTEWLLAAVRANRFLPVPPSEKIYVGDGDFRAIGAEFLGHFIRRGGLKPTDRVLDIGCGIGRMAVPLTQYLDPRVGSYDGVDPVAAGIAWCATTISPVYPRFRFQHLDIAHPLYNPGGMLPGRRLALGFPSESFDFCCMVSVATHLPPEEMEVYAREVSRLLVPGGRLFLTAFLIGTPPGPNPPRLDMRRWGDGPAWIADPEAPLGAIGFDERFLVDTLKRVGLVVRRVGLGHWSGHESPHYQDILVAVKQESPR